MLVEIAAARVLGMVIYGHPETGLLRLVAPRMYVYARVIQRNVKISVHDRNEIPTTPVHRACCTRDVIILFYSRSVRYFAL